MSVLTPSLHRGRFSKHLHIAAFGALPLPWLCPVLTCMSFPACVSALLTTCCKGYSRINNTFEFYPNVHVMLQGPLFLTKTMT